MNSSTPIIVAGVSFFFAAIGLIVAYWYLYIRDGVDDLKEYLPPTSEPTSGPTSGPFPGPAPGPSPPPPPPVSDSSDVIEQIQDIITDLENIDVQSLDITSTCIGNGLENGCDLQEE